MQVARSPHERPAQLVAKLLAERETKEVNDITFIITELRKTIEEKLDHPKMRQMTEH